MESFLQHCQLPLVTPHQHRCALTDELTKHTAQANNTPKGRHLLKLLITWIDDLLTPSPILDEQRMNKVSWHETREAEHTVIDETPIITIPYITKAKSIIKLGNPMAKCVLKTTPRLHQWFTCNNSPSVIPAPWVIEPITPIAPINPQQPTQVQPWRSARAMHTALPSGMQQCLVTQQAINVFTMCEQASFSTISTLLALMKLPKSQLILNIMHMQWCTPSPVTRF